MPEEEFGISLESQQKASNLGIILSILIAVLVLLLIGLYVWGNALRDATEAPTIPDFTRPTAAENNEPESTRAEAETDNLGTLSNSDSIEAIEADLNSTDVDDLDSGLNTIEAEIITE